MSQKMGQGQTMGQLSQKVGQMSQNLNFKDKKWDKVLKNGTRTDKGTFVPMGQDRTRQWDICPKKQGHLSS